MTTRKNGHKPKEAEIAPESLEESADILLGILETAGGVGNEDVEGGQVPIIKLLQKMSPELDDISEQFIADAGEGEFFIPHLDELRDTFQFIPLIGKTVFMEWAPRDSGGGLAGIHLPGAPILSAPGTVQDGNSPNFITEEGNALVKTTQIIGYVLPAEGYDPHTTPLTQDRISVLSFSKTNSREGQAFMRLVSCKTFEKNGQTVKAPMPAGVYTVTSKKVVKDKNSWYISPVLETRNSTKHELAELAKLLPECKEQMDNLGAAQLPAAKQPAALPANSSATVEVV